MTVNSSSTLEFDIGQIITGAYRSAGLLSIHQSASTAQLSHGAQELELILDDLQADGVMFRTQDWYDLTLTAGTGIYSLPANYLDVIGTGQYIGADETDTDRPSVETQVTVMNQAEWQALTPKDATSQRVTRMYVHRASSTLEVMVWPMPTEAGTIRLRIQRMLADSDDTTKTVDLDRPWGQFLKLELAHSLILSHSRDLGRAAYFRRLADQTKQKCKGFATEHAPQGFTFAHQTAWSRH
jgi:hypothetical protein